MSSMTILYIVSLPVNRPTLQYDLNGVAQFPTSEEVTGKEVIVNEVDKLLVKIKSQAIGYDSINLKMLTLVLPYLTVYAPFIIKTCLRNAVCSVTWEMVDIIPIPKSTDANIPEQ